MSGNQEFVVQLIRYMIWPVVISFCVWLLRKGLNERLKEFFLEYGKLKIKTILSEQMKDKKLDDIEPIEDKWPDAPKEALRKTHELATASALSVIESIGTKKLFPLVVRERGLELSKKIPQGKRFVEQLIGIKAKEVGVELAGDIRWSEPEDLSEKYILEVKNTSGWTIDKGFIYDELIKCDTDIQMRFRVEAKTESIVLQLKKNE